MSYGVISFKNRCYDLSYDFLHPTFQSNDCLLLFLRTCQVTSFENETVFKNIIAIVIV